MTAPSNRLEIADVVAGLAHAQDDKDWDRFRQLFADRVVLDASSHLRSEPVELSLDELTALAEGVINGFDFTQHITSNLMVEIDGNRASGRAHAQAYHYLPNDDVDFCTARSTWELSLHREDGKWLIHKWAVVRKVPLEGNPDLYEMAAAALQSQ